MWSVPNIVIIPEGLVRVSVLCHMTTNQPDYGFTSTSEPPQQRQGNGLSIAGLVLGIISLPGIVLTVIDIPIAILAIIFGGVGLSKSKRTGTGKGMATAGLIMGILGLILAVVLFVWVAGEMNKEHGRYRTFGSLGDWCETPVS
jgi:hypothetical protein